MLQSVIDLVSSIIGIYIFCVIAWAVLSTLISFNIINRYQPFAQKAMRILDQLVQPALRPLQRILPNLGGLDLSPIILIFLLTFLQQFIYGLVDARYSYIAIIQLISSLIVLYMYCVGMYAVFGLLVNFRLVNPHQMLVSILMTILRALVNRPVIALRRYLPPVGKVDLAPWVLLLLLILLNQAVLRLLVL